MDNEVAVATELARRFISRRDVKAVQQADGSYRPDRSPWKMSALCAHLRGEVSLGHYLVDAEGQTKLVAFDLDLEKEGSYQGEAIRPREVWDAAPTEAKQALARELRCLAEGLACHLVRGAEIPVAIAHSGGKGLHVYGFTGPLPAADARAIAITLLEGLRHYRRVRGDAFWKHEWAYPNVGIEVFPKQDQVRQGDGLGNLMRLPLGIHRRTGRPGFFLRAGCWKAEDPLTALANGTITPAWLAAPAP